VKNSLWIALRVFAVTFVVLGLGYPLLVTGIAQVAMRGPANGSLVHSADGGVVGSRLLGQTFEGEGYFHSRPSAGGYDPMSSGASNLGPTSKVLDGQLKERAAASGESGKVAADALTASGSGLDPDISPANARAQVARVAAARGVAAAEVEELVKRSTSGCDLGFIGEPRVNVLELNLALDAALGRP